MCWALVVGTLRRAEKRSRKPCSISVPAPHEVEVPPHPQSDPVELVMIVGFGELSEDDRLEFLRQVVPSLSPDTAP